jgi:hypothetical protein
MGSISHSNITKKSGTNEELEQNQLRSREEKDRNCRMPEMMIRQVCDEI